MSLVGILIALVILGLIYWLITMLPLPAPFKQIAMVIMIIIAILWLASMVGGGDWLNFGHHSGANLRVN
jgi:hypothetical protein